MITRPNVVPTVLDSKWGAYSIGFSRFGLGVSNMMTKENAMPTVLNSRGSGWGCGLGVSHVITKQNGGAYSIGFFEVRAGGVLRDSWTKWGVYSIGFSRFGLGVSIVITREKWVPTVLDSRGSGWGCLT